MALFFSSGTTVNANAKCSVLRLEQENGAFSKVRPAVWDTAVLGGVAGVEVAELVLTSSAML